jgi:plasmid replication initiation protein
MRNILKKMIKIEINDTWLRMPWFAAIVIDNDYVVFEFSDTMNKFLYNLKKGFTMYHISMILKLSKFSSIRLYELFKKYEKLQTFNYPLEKLKMITGHEGKYEQYKSYKQKILIPSIEEVNNCTDLLINFSENKERHRVVGIKFFIEGKRSIRYEK